MTVLQSREKRRDSPVEQELPTLPEQLRFTPGF